MLLKQNFSLPAGNFPYDANLGTPYLTQEIQRINIKSDGVSFASGKTKGVSFASGKTIHNFVVSFQFGLYQCFTCVFHK